MISRRAFIGGTALSIAAPSVLRAQGQRTLKISHQFPGGTIEKGDFRDRLCRRFAAEVEARTQGALKFEIYPGSSLMKTKAQFSAVRRGALDFTLYPLPYAGGEVQAMNLGLMPCLVTNYEQGAKWKTAAIGKAMMRIAEAKGVKFIAWIWQAGGVASRSKAIKAPDDVQGLKVRGGSREMDLMLAAAGAQISTMPSNEIYLGMQTGALDTALTSSTSLISFRLEELAKALTTARNGSIWFMCEPLLMSQTVFDSLPPAQQKIIAEVGAEMEPFGTAEAKKDDEEVAKVYAAKGGTVVDFSQDDLAKWRAIAEVTAWKDFAARSSEAAELLASARSLG
ncbi:MAG: TRAP transporter substrate-binding protein DctP [Rhodomicrobium sp.]